MLLAGATPTHGRGRLARGVASLLAVAVFVLALSAVRPAWGAPAVAVTPCPTMMADLPHGDAGPSQHDPTDAPAQGRGHCLGAACAGIAPAVPAPALVLVSTPASTTVEAWPAAPMVGRVVPPGLRPPQPGA